QGNLGPFAAGDVERDQLTGADAGADVQPVADPGEAPGVVAAVVAGAAVGPRLAGGQVVGVHLGPGVAAEVEGVAVGDDVADHRVRHHASAATGQHVLDRPSGVVVAVH